MVLSPLLVLLNIVLVVPANAVRSKKYKTGLNLRKQDINLSTFADDMTIYI